MKTTHSVTITDSSVTVDGQPLVTSATGSKLLDELYRSHVGDYPKFHKMDTLSKLGFIASELLLNAESHANHTPRFTPNESRAVVCGNRSASIVNDLDYSATIQPGNYYPSPALFVYTLPNIVTGEIAIRNHLFGETCFYVTDNIDTLRTIVSSMNVESAIIGWLECTSHDTFQATMDLSISDI